MPSNSRPLTGKTTTILAPGAVKAAVQVMQPKPCIVILVHGVNDLAGVYEDLEAGLCEGLNERLDHLTTAQGKRSPAALNPATYTLPKDDGGKAPNPDAVYYRRRASQGRHGGPSRSVVIPFYWGFREEEGRIDKETAHGEWLDRFGNRLDKAGTKEGGAFANATTTLPDMFGDGFSGKVAGAPANWLFGSPDHPLFPGPSRRYMVLAAQRLAMLVRIIRGYKGRSGKDGENDTINVVGHSQGTLITLLANAMLKDQGHRPVDGVIMMHSPYSLAEAYFESRELGQAQQTTLARLQTLTNIVKFIGSQPNTVPSLADAADASRRGCIGGLRWTGGACKTRIGGVEVPFTERDNRGGTFLYFSPQDQTVGMANVQGIGWQGVSDTAVCDVFESSAPASPPSAPAYVYPPRSGRLRRLQRLPALPALGERFFQRVFTIRVRDGAGEQVGKPPAYTYVLVGNSVFGLGETTWEGARLSTGRKAVANADFAPGQTVTVQAPALPVPFVPDFTAGGTSLGEKGSRGIKPVWQPTDPIDASISITNKGIQDAGTRVVALPDSAGPLSGAYYNRGRAMAFSPQLEARLTGLNDPARNPYDDPTNNAWAADWHRISAAVYQGGRDFLVTYQESPNEARRRMMDAPPGDNEAISFHSAIPAQALHSRRATAYDLAIGQARSIDDEAFYAYLCRVADWRLGWKRKRNGSRPTTEQDSSDDNAWSFYRQETEKHQELIRATEIYHGNAEPTRNSLGEIVGGGFLPKSAAEDDLPKLVVSQTLEDRSLGREPKAGPRDPKKRVRA